MIRTVKVWCRYDPQKHTIASLHKFKYGVKPRAGCIILQLRGTCAAPNDKGHRKWPLLFCPLTVTRSRRTSSRCR